MSPACGCFLRADEPRFGKIHFTRASTTKGVPSAWLLIRTRIRSTEMGVEQKRKRGNDSLNERLRCKAA
jgi:hypothetical protein